MFICDRCKEQGKRCAGPWCRKCYFQIKKENPNMELPKPPTSICVECKSEFQPKRWGERFGRYCSAKCRDRFKLKTDSRREYMRNYYKNNPEQKKKRSERARKWWTAEKRYKYHPLKTGPRPDAWNKGLTVEDPRVALYVRKSAQTRHARKTLTEKEKTHLSSMIRYGKENNFWKGGITPYEHSLLTSKEGREWSKYIIKKFGGKCYMCNASNCRLVAHHYFPRKYFPELAHHKDNGCALCISCHRKLHGKAPKNPSKNMEWRKRVLVPSGLCISDELKNYLFN